MSLETDRQSGSGQGSLVTGAAPRLFKRAFDILAGQIANGSLQRGTKLQESGVAARFGISRSPARRALAELHKIGLVEKSPGRGYTVKGAQKKFAASPGTGETEQSWHLTSRPSWERIFAEVENEIGARLCFGSWRVNEAQLARYHGVSRTVARDVLARMQQRGLISKDERSRWFAPELTPAHISELYELRGVLEPVALKKAAAKMDRYALEMAHHNLLDAIASPDSVSGATLDRLEEELHVSLLSYCGSRTLMQAIAQPQSLLIAHRFLYRWTPHLFDVEPFLPEHLAIVEHLLSGRADAAAAILEDHLRRSSDRATKRVEFVMQEFFPEALPYLEAI